jgi:DNA-3-methyladenine glycosylase I
MTSALVRCEWAGDDPVMVSYHDDEWGQPLHDERRLFEMLCLEGAQAGLSWAMILRRRDGYRAAYEDFDAELIARYDDARQAELLTDARIIRNRLKVNAFRENARAVLRLRETDGGLDGYVWSRVDWQPVVNRFDSLSGIPVSSPLATELSRDLGRRGFRFVGPVIVYAYLQSVGVVNDHEVRCFRHPGVSGTAA